MNFNILTETKSILEFEINKIKMFVETTELLTTLIFLF